MKTSSSLRRIAISAAIVAGLTAGIGFATEPTSCNLKVVKFYDKNANGLYDAGDRVIVGWPMTLGRAGSEARSTQLTNSSGQARWSLLPAGGGYWVGEAMPVESNWVQSAPVDADGNPVNPVTDVTLIAGRSKVIKFGNYCLAPSGGRTPGFWSNKNGRARLLDELDGAEEELALLRDLNLVDGNGLPFDPTTAEEVQAWINKTNATNMAAKLSSHLAAMVLNREAGFVNGTRTYLPFGGTINELIALANESLARDQFTPTGDEERAIQEQLKDHLDALNNGANAVAAKPCKRTF
ncbi:hypothetical protein [Cognatilysobacter bugurensis]|nr:hypothetical protein [Lysobacter bugurensis]